MNNSVTESFDYLKKLSTSPKVSKIDSRQEDESAFLCIMIHKERYYLSLDWIKEVVPQPKITQIGHTQGWFKGIIKSQGEIYSVLDIAPTLGLPAIEKKRYAITLSLPSGYFAVLASNVLGIAKVCQLEKLAEDEFTISYQAANKEHIVEISIKSVIENPAFSNISIF